MVVLRLLPKKNLAPSLQFGLWHHGLRRRGAASSAGWGGPSCESEVRRRDEERREDSERKSERKIRKGGATE